MDDEFLDPMKFSVDEIREQFEKHKLRFEQRIQQNQQLSVEFLLSKELSGLQKDVKQLHDGMKKLEEMQMSLTCWQDTDAIESWPTTENEREIKQIQTDTEIVGDGDVNTLRDTELKVQQPEKLVISCGSSPCLFQNCRRRVNSQLLLLHYISDHSDENIASQRCHRLQETDTVIFSFDPKRCKFRHNQVLGLLTYGGKKAGPCPMRHIYNSFLPQQLVHLECDVPVVVLICKTSPNLQMRDKELSHREDMVYVIWLVTPHNMLQLHANLCICGRDPASRRRTTIPVRLVHDEQNASEFIHVDANYWRLSFDEIHKISNGLRDELHLEIGLSCLSFFA